MTEGDGPARRPADQPDQPVRYPLARPLLLSPEQFGLLTGLHPDLVQRFTALGLLRADRDTAGRLWLRPDQLTAAARIQRLRAGLPLNYAAIGLVIDLLDRITELETALHTTTLDTTTLHTRQRSSRWS